MGRICDAIDVLFNGLPAAPGAKVREVETLGPPANVQDVTLYRIEAKPFHYQVVAYEWPTGHFANCADAFASIPKEAAGYLCVETVEAIRVGNRYFRRSPLFLHKPKADKGKRTK